MLANSKVLVLGLLFITNFCVAQLVTGDFNVRFQKQGKLSQEALNKFKSSTTKFILPGFFTEKEYDQILSEIWTLTPYQILKKGEYEIDELVSGDGVVEFVSLIVDKVKDNEPIASNGYFYLNFYVEGKPKVRKNGKRIQKKDNIGSIFFTPNMKLSSHISPDIKTENVRGKLLNFELGYLKNLLQQMHDCIDRGLDFNFKNDFSRDEIFALTNIELLIDSAFYNENLLEGYDYHYEVLNYNVLESKILAKVNGVDNFYYLVLNEVSGVKIITVINGITGNIVYQHVKNGKSDFEPRDFKILSNSIKERKANK